MNAPIRATGKPTYEELMAMVLDLRDKLADAPKPRGISYKISEKGAVAILGLRRFPVVLYAGELDRIIADFDNLRAFLDTNRAKLATKSVA